MKNVIKTFGIIALAAIIGLSMTACGGGGGGGSAEKPDTSGSTIASGATVSTPKGLKATDFSYIWVGSLYSATNIITHYVDPLSKYLDGDSSVKISGGKINIKLGTPKPKYLSDLSSAIKNGLKVSDKDVKTYGFDEFCTSKYEYVVYCLKDGTNMYDWAALLYADRDAIADGSYTYTDDEEFLDTWEDYPSIPNPNYGYTHTYIYKNLSAKKGWNYVISSTDRATKTTTYTSSVSQPNGYIWAAFDVKDLDAMYSIKAQKSILSLINGVHNQQYNKN